jgi:hypothetical protein
MRLPIWTVLLETEKKNLFTLTIEAINEKGAKSRAKHLSEGCLVRNVTEVPY